MFDRSGAAVRYSRELFGCGPNRPYLEQLLRDLALLDRRRDLIMTLSGGMKRRVMIAKALSHEPQILFLDEPTAGVDVELRRDMWALVRGLRERGVTIILTTHYIEEAEEMADRVGVIRGGELILVEDKATLMRKLGSKQLTLQLLEPMTEVPPALRGWDLSLARRRTRAAISFQHRQRRARRHPRAAAPAERARHRLQGPAHQPEFARGHLRRPRSGSPADSRCMSAPGLQSPRRRAPSTSSRWLASAARSCRAS